MQVSGLKIRCAERLTEMNGHGLLSTSRASFTTVYVTVRTLGDLSLRVCVTAWGEKL
jgi:hypothetical protein